jgi:uncharacterized membrane protein YqaE (UPF0057 family)
MALYWTVKSDSIHTEKVDSVSKISLSDTKGVFYAQGDIVDFESFWGIDMVRTAECRVIESDISEKLINKTSYRTGYKNRLVFENCKIKSLIISELEFNSLSFINCKIDNIEILECINKYEIKFQKTTINNLEIRNNHELNSIQIIDSNIIEIAIFQGNISIDNFQIINSQIGVAKFLKNKQIANFKLERCQFNEFLINESPINKTVSIIACSKGLLEFELNRFESKEIEINNCTNIVKFVKCRAYEKIIFRFNNSSNCEYSFLRCYFAEEVLFQGNISGNKKNLLIKETVFKDLVLFDDDNAKSLVIEESSFQKGVLIPVEKYLKSTKDVSSSVWCLLKNKALSNNDNISALEYRKNELKSYAKELKLKKKSKQERFVLFLNRISNNHGKNWVLGCGFTLGSWLVFYTIFFSAKSNFCFFNYKDCSLAIWDKEFWIDALHYLWLPEGLSELSKGLYKNDFWLGLIIMILSYIIGKIFIAYGIFQTISSFRRHGKN